MMFGYGGGWAVLMVVGMLAFFGLVIWAVYVVFAAGESRRGDVGGSRSSPSAAREVLDGRLARGEINTDEYRQLVDTISAGGR